MTDSAWLDFNDAPEQREEATPLDTDALRQGLLDRIEAVLFYLFPAGRIRGGKFYVGDVDGNPGKSLVVELEGERKGLWHDFATDEGGDLIALWARARWLSAQHDFPKLATEIQQWLGVAPPIAPADRHKRRTVAIDERGPHTAKWDYWSVDGRLLACVYRYDPPTGKEFIPRDVVRGVNGAPDPRPLYNLPGIAKASSVVLVEGEKCAQALIDVGICATTAMSGGRAPTDKTDWSPLADKDLIVWPDRDATGWHYAESSAQAAVKADAASVTILVPPVDKPEKWDVADAIAEGFDWRGFLAQGERRIVKADDFLPAYTAGDVLDDDSPDPPELIDNAILPPGATLVFGGAAKVGKSDFLLSWLAHMAAGASFLDMRPPRPLRVFYLQAEVQYVYLRRRLRAVHLPASRILEVRANLVVTPQLHVILNEGGVSKVIKTIRRFFNGEPPDVIAIDPIRNVFDGGGSGGENDNTAMLHFLIQRIEAIRLAVNPAAGVILVHHTKKLPKKQFEEDPFQALAGASALRGYYASGMVLFCPEEGKTTRQLYFELRNGPALPLRHVDKVNGEWREVHPEARLIRQDYGERLDAERRRKRDVILQILFDEASQGRAYTCAQFAERFEGQGALGAHRTIRERLAVLSTKGYIKYFRNAAAYGLPSPQGTKFGYMCVEGMLLHRLTDQTDPETGEIRHEELPVAPTHYKCPSTGGPLPVEDPNTWIYHDEEE